MSRPASRRCTGRRSRWLALTVATVLCAATDARAATPVSTITDAGGAVQHHRQSQQADELISNGNHAAAVPLLEQLVARYPADGGLWDALGYACYNSRSYARAIEAYTRATQIGVPFRTFALYNLACCLALDGRTEEAVVALREALAAGFENRPLVGEDTDLVSLHDHPAWPELAGLLPEDVAAAGRDAGWRYDLAFWAAEVRRLHPDPFRTVGEAGFDARVASLHEAIPTLDDEAIMVGLQKLTVLLGDGHSGIRTLPHSRVQVRMLPIQLYAFADGLFVIAADSANAGLVGSELLGIGSREVATLLPALEPLVPRDNPMGLLDMGPMLLTITAMLRAIGAIDDTGTVPLTLRDPHGAERRLTLTAQPMHRANRELVAPAGPKPPPVPLFLAREDEVFWFDALPDLPRGLYVQFNAIVDGPGSTVREHAMRLREHLQSRPDLDVVVLDLRHNGGGNSFLYPRLVRVLSEFQLERPEARLYVLAGRRTFSACQNLATDLDWWTSAIFVGEPTGSSPNQIGESTFSVLPFSGLRAGISSRYHQQSYPGDERPWIAPDLPVAFTSEAYFAGRDPVLEAVVAAERAR